MEGENEEQVIWIRDRKQDLVFPSQGKAGDQPAGYDLSSHEATRNVGYQQQGESPDSCQSEGK